MGLKLIRMGVDCPYTIFDALRDFQKPKEKRVLMFIHKETGRGLRVVGWDPEKQIVKLRWGNRKKLLQPHITEREAALYEPMWR